MAGLKLAKLPDRKLVKLTISVPPELNKSLIAYAEAYRNVYQVSEKISDLIPAMLESFLANDKEFVKARKGGACQTLR
jgi:hypothetical protein